MKFLIGEDDPALAELNVELPFPLDGQTQQVEAITLASDAQWVIYCLREHDTVLCHSTFPLPRSLCFGVKEWDVVRQEANRRDIRPVLYRDSVRTLDRGRKSRTIAMPADIGEICAGPIRRPWPMIAKSPRKSPKMSEGLNLTRENHVPKL